MQYTNFERFRVDDSKTIQSRCCSTSEHPLEILPSNAYKLEYTQAWHIGVKLAAISILIASDSFAKRSIMTPQPRAWLRCFDSVQVDVLECIQDTGRSQMLDFPDWLCDKKRQEESSRNSDESAISLHAVTRETPICRHSKHLRSSGSATYQAQSSSLVKMNVAITKEPTNFVIVLALNQERAQI